MLSRIVLVSISNYHGAQPPEAFCRLAGSIVKAIDRLNSSADLQEVYYNETLILIINMAPFPLGNTQF